MRLPFAMALLCGCTPPKATGASDVTSDGAGTDGSEATEDTGGGVSDATDEVGGDESEDTETGDDGTACVDWELQFERLHWDLGLTADATGRVYLAMATEEESESSRVVLREIDPEGRVVWTTELDSGEEDIAEGVAVHPGGGIVAIGSTDGVLSGTASLGERDAFVARVSEDGEVQWVTQFGDGGHDDGYAVVVDDDGRIYATGGSFPPFPEPGSLDILTAGFSPDGEVEWLDIHGPDLNYVGRDLVLSGEESLLILADVRESGPSGGVGLLEYGLDGTPLSTAQFYIVGQDFPSRFAVDAQGTAYICGLGDLTTGWAFAVSSTGAVTWTDLWLPEEYTGSCRGIDLDAAGNVYATFGTRAEGESTFDGNWNVAIRRYLPDGTIETTKSFGEETAHRPLASVVVDEGHHYVAGYRGPNGPVFLARLCSP